jgi:hypothetical protein
MRQSQPRRSVSRGDNDLIGDKTLARFGAPSYHVKKMSYHRKGNVVPTIRVTPQIVPRDRRRPLSTSMPRLAGPGHCRRAGGSTQTPFARFIREFPGSTVNVIRFSTS